MSEKTLFLIELTFALATIVLLLTFNPSMEVICASIALALFGFNAGMAFSSMLRDGDEE